MKFTQSIRWRLLAWIAIFLSLVLAGLDIAAAKIHYNDQLNQLDEELRARVVSLSTSLFTPGFNSGPRGNFGSQPPGNFQRNRGNTGHGGNGDNDGGRDFPEPPPDGFLGSPPDGPPNGPPGERENRTTPRSRPPLDSALVNAAIEQFEISNTNDCFFVIWTEETSAPYKRSAELPDNLLRPQTATHDTGTYVRTASGFREMYHATERGDCVMVGGSLTPLLADTRRFAAMVSTGSLGVLLLGLGGMWLIIGGALRPVKKISAVAEQIAMGKLSERINAEETDNELGQLVAVLNSTFARLETAFAQQKQFTADAAHELRTPIAVLISEAQTTLARERQAGDYRDALSASLETAQQMRRLTDSLLQLARLDAGQEILRREKIGLDVLAQDGVKLIQPLAAARNLRIECDLPPVTIFADPGRMSQVITNLLSNAVRYNREGGSIRIATGSEQGNAWLTVSDTGQGIAAADLPYVFERFYRADKSRSTAGTGLGLSICQAIIKAHGGTIEAISNKDQGATFTVRLRGAEG